jgi:4-amino-4-deoxy-L-arabinose transferase-like glycosyltransferase
VSLNETIRRRPFLALTLLALLLSLAFQGSRGLWEPDEGRYTNVALQILRSGDWISLYRHHDSFHFTKPPLTYWAMAASVKVFGYNEWAVRLPMALAYTFTVLMLYRLGRTFVPTRPWLPALIYATAPLPFLAANAITTDDLLAAMETLAVLCFVQARLAGESRRWLDGMWLAFGLAFLTKGPPALLPLLAIIAFLALHGRVRDLWRPLGLIGFAVVGLGWYVMVIVRHPGLLDYFIGHEVVARVASDELHRFPQWYGWLLVYLPTLLLGGLPWIAVALWRTPWRVQRWANADEPKRFLWLWLCLPLLVFCLARSRLPLYVLPLFVPLSLLMARTLERANWHWLATTLLSLWVLALLSLKLGLTFYLHAKDTREFAGTLQHLVPGRLREIVFVEDMTRYGLHLYTGAEVEKVSFKPHPKPISDADFDNTLAVALHEQTTRRVFIMKRSNEGYFLTAVQANGMKAELRGVIPEEKKHTDASRDRMIYTLVGDFPPR